MCAKDGCACVQAKGVEDAGAAAVRVSGLEVGGLFGSLLAGRISDWMVRRDARGGNVGKRVQVRTPRLPACAGFLHAACALQRCQPASIRLIMPTERLESPQRVVRCGCFFAMLSQARELSCHACTACSSR